MSAEAGSNGYLFEESDMLSDDQLDSFQRNGYLVIEPVLDDSDLEPLEREYAALLDELANRLYQQGEIDSAYAEFDFTERFARVVAQYPECIDRMNISLPLENGEIDADRYQAHTVLKHQCSVVTGDHIVAAYVGHGETEVRNRLIRKRK